MKVVIPFTFLKPGECLNCGSVNLYILEKDINGIRVERDGELTDVTNLAHASKTICIQCNSEFEYERFGMYARPLTKSKQINFTPVKANLLKLPDLLLPEPYLTAINNLVGQGISYEDAKARVMGTAAQQPTIVTGKQIGRASCRERVSSPV